MATKKSEATMGITTNAADDFKQSMIDVGIKLCDEIKQGTAKNNTDNLNAIIGLYNAIKA